MPLYRLLNADRRLLPFRATELGSRYQEHDLENWIESNPQVLLQDEPLLIIGRQVNTPVGTIDLLGLDSSGAGVIIELKRAPNQREVIAQALEYVSWLSGLEPGHLRGIAEDYLRKKGSAQSFDEAWQETFGGDLEWTTLNKQQRLFVVLKGEDERITSVARFLRTSGVDISLLTYNFYQTEGGEEILNFEMEVGPLEDLPPTKLTEDTLLRGWDAAAVEAYGAFKSVLLTGGLFLSLRKTGMSFIKQTGEGPVFICYFYARGPHVGIWLRSDSLGLLFDFQSVAEEIKSKLPKDAAVRHTPTWFIISLPPSVESAVSVANTLLANVVDKLQQEPGS
jgi:Holliday junction resolvase-like predicted endonuclease